MQKFKAKFTKPFALVISLMLTLFIFSGFTTGTGFTTRAGSVFESEAKSEMFEESGIPALEVKEYWEPDINEDFDDSSVLVVMDKQTGGINKQYEERFFGSFAKEAIYDLSYIGDARGNKISENDAKELRSLDTENFNQILQIKLPENSKENVINVIKQLEEIDGILWAGPNHYGNSALQPANANGTRYPQQWGLHGTHGIQAETAWDITTGNRATVRVGVIDSGLDAHPDLNANRVNEGGDFVNMANLNNNIPGTLRADPSGHGTQVAGVIGATGTVADGVAGVCWNVQLIPLQVSIWSSNAWRLDTAATARSITWAANNNVDVLNLSGTWTAEPVAIRNAISNFNGVFVAAAGNGDANGNGINNDTTRIWPSDYSRGQTFSNRVISVGAINSAGNRTTWSNYGAESVSLFAPGNGILTTAVGGGYSSVNGTSFAAPIVAGVAALIKSTYSSATGVEIKNAIMFGSDAALSTLCVAGGRLNAYKSLNNFAQLVNDGKIYNIKNLGSGLAMTASSTANASAVKQNTFTGALNQQWKAVYHSDDGTYSFMPMNALSKWLEAKNYVTTIHDNAMNNSKRYYLTYASGRCRITPKTAISAGNINNAIIASNNTNGLQLIEGAYTASTLLHNWNFEETSWQPEEGKVYNVKNAGSGLALTASGTANASAVKQNSFTGALNQQWKAVYHSDDGTYSFMPMNALSKWMEAKSMVTTIHDNAMNNTKRYYVVYDNGRCKVVGKSAPLAGNMNNAIIASNNTNGLQLIEGAYTASNLLHNWVFQDAAVWQPEHGKIYRIKNAGSGLYINANASTNGSVVSQQPNNGTLNQQWMALYNNDDGTYSFTPLHVDNKRLEAANYKTTIHDDKLNNMKRYYVVYDSSGRCRIVGKSAPLAGNINNAVIASNNTSGLQLIEGAYTASTLLHNWLFEAV